MPELSRFYGIVIRINFRDHAPPHFHAEYGEQEMVVGIRPVRELAGRLPRRAASMVLDWAVMHEQEILDAWNAIQTRQPYARIDPLP